MTTKIYNVTDLQNMNLDLTAAYELANDIDASATSGWNAGAGFVPLGFSSQQILQFQNPINDHSQAGTWGVYPASPTSMFDKVDDDINVSPYSDHDATYIVASSAGAYALFGIPSLVIPSDASRISIGLGIYYRKTTSDACSIQRYLRVAGANYLMGAAVSPTTSWGGGAVSYSTNPATGLAWTLADLSTIEACGVYVHTATSPVRISRLFVAVYYRRYFIGSLDGKGYTITGLYINRPTEDDVGLFGYANGATIQDVTLSGFTISGDYGVAACVGEADTCIISHIVITNLILTGADELHGGLAGYTNDCVISDCSASVTLTGGQCSGGLIGWARTSSGTQTITDCHTSGTITIIGGVNNWFGGGLVGSVNRGTVTRCSSTCDISSIDADKLGGLLGSITATGGEGIVSQCYATGNVDAGLGSTVGGLIGSIVYAGAADIVTISDCYSRGNVSSSDISGGLIGSVYEYTGDVITIERCYSIGKVTSAEYHENDGGLIISSDGADVADCFWDTQASECATSDGGTGKTTAEMKVILTFVAWDIQTNSTNLNNGYPYLAWQLPGSSPIWYIYAEADLTPANTDVQIVALEAIRNIEMAAMGRVYVDESGNLCYENRYARQL